MNFVVRENRPDSFKEDSVGFITAIIVVMEKRLVLTERISYEYTDSSSNHLSDSFYLIELFGVHRLILSNNYLRNTK